MDEVKKITAKVTPNSKSQKRNKSKKAKLREETSNFTIEPLDMEIKEEVNDEPGAYQDSDNDHAESLYENCDNDVHPKSPEPEAPAPVTITPLGIEEDIPVKRSRGRPPGSGIKPRKKKKKHDDDDASQESNSSDDDYDPEKEELR